MSVVYKKLEDVCEILDSRRVPITAKDRKAGTYPYYGANGLQDYVADYIFDDELVLLAEDGGNFGSKERPIAYRVSGKCWVNNHAHVLKAKPNMHVDYLCYALMFYDTEGLVNGATRQKLTQAAMRQMVIPYRDMTEQLQIIKKISQIVRSIEKRKEELQLLDQLVKSRFIELFGDPETNPKGWTRQRLDQICENLDSRRVPITSTDRKAGNYPYYGASGIVDYVKDYIFDEDILLISEDGANLVMRSTPIAFSVSGKVWVNNHAHVVRFESKATQKYIEICFALTDISGSITGTAQPKLNQAKLNAMMFCVPPIELQEQFATFVEQTDKSKLAVQKGLQELEILKKSLMQQYFG